MLVGARSYFSASHTLPQHPEIHGHSYEVWAYGDGVGLSYDVEDWQTKLILVCGELDHKMLPPELSKMEDMARWIGNRMAAKKVKIIRPVEGLCAEWEASSVP